MYINRIFLFYTVALIFILFFIVFFLFFDENEFLHWDDITYISKNPNIQTLNLDSIVWMFTQYYLHNWHPLTWFSHAADIALWGLDPVMHRLGNVILHGINTILVFYLASLVFSLANHKISDSEFSLASEMALPAFLAALFFAIHPQHVESVAWIAERKDVLCAMFYLLTLIAYLRYGSDPVRQLWKYLSLVFFLLAVMSKSMAVSIPIVLLLMDLYPLRRFESKRNKFSALINLIQEKWIFFFLSAGIVLVTLFTQQQAIKPLDAVDFSARLLNAAYSLIFYFEKWLLPVGFSPFYPYPEWILHREVTSVLPVLILVAVIAFFIWEWKKGRHYWLIALLYYIITILPVIGIIQVGDQAAADRYAYLPTISFYLLPGLGLSRLWGKWRFPNRLYIGMPCLILTVCFLMYQTRQQVLVWRNDETLWQAVIERFPGRVALAHSNLGNAYFSSGQTEEAVSEYRKALQINPSYTKVYENLGAAYEALGDEESALEQYRELLEFYPDGEWVYKLVGDAYLRHGHNTQAAEYYRQALFHVRQSPDASYAETQYLLGYLYYRFGKIPIAITHLDKALEVNSNYVEALLLLARLYLLRGDSQQSADTYQRVLMLDPTNHVASRALRRLERKEK